MEPLPGQTVVESILNYKIIDEQHYPTVLLTHRPGPSAALFRLEQSRRLEDIRAGVIQLERELRRPEQIGLREDFGVWLSEVLLPRRTLDPARDVPEARNLTEIKTMLERTVQKLTQQWKAEGLQEGIQKGIQKGIRTGRVEGRDEGRLIGQRELLLRLLEKKFERLSSEDCALVNSANEMSLEKWTDRVLAARSLAEVFAPHQNA